MNDEQHGTRAGFESGCLCDECRIARQAQRQQWWPMRHTKKGKRHDYPAKGTR